MKSDFFIKSALIPLIAFALLLAGCGNGEQEDEDGLIIEDTVTGDGAEASAGDILQVHYTGYFEDGEIFDSSLQREPFTFQLGAGQVIEGWDRGFEGMRVGGTRVLTIPPEMAYGEEGRPGAIPPSATLRFEVELLDIFSEPDGVWEYSEDDVVTTDSGLRYVIVQEGDGEELGEGDVALVHYDGFLEDGTLFDTSARRGQPLRVQVGVGMVMRGWDEGLTGMREGERRILFIPSDLAYGNQARGDLIPANSNLNFNVEVVEKVQ